MKYQIKKPNISQPSEISVNVLQYLFEQGLFSYSWPAKAEIENDWTTIGNPYAKIQGHSIVKVRLLYAFVFLPKFLWIAFKNWLDHLKIKDFDFERTYQEAQQALLQGNCNQALEGFKSIYELDIFFRDVAEIVDDYYFSKSSRPEEEWITKYTARFKSNNVTN